jgi:hypothetical protein
MEVLRGCERVIRLNEPNSAVGMRGRVACNCTVACRCGPRRCKIGHAWRRSPKLATVSVHRSATPFEHVQDNIAKRWRTIILNNRYQRKVKWQLPGYVLTIVEASPVGFLCKSLSSCQQRSSPTIQVSTITRICLKITLSQRTAGGLQHRFFSAVLCCTTVYTSTF